MAMAGERWRESDGGRAAWRWRRVDGRMKALVVARGLAAEARELCWRKMAKSADFLPVLRADCSLEHESG